MNIIPLDVRGIEMVPFMDINSILRYCETSSESLDICLLPRTWTYILYRDFNIIAPPQFGYESEARYISRLKDLYFAQERYEWESNIYSKIERFVDSYYIWDIRSLLKKEIGLGTLSVPEAEEDDYSYYMGSDHDIITEYLENKILQLRGRKIYEMDVLELIRELKRQRIPL